jgi:hypothetical protein
MEGLLKPTHFPVVFQKIIFVGLMCILAIGCTPQPQDPPEADKVLAVQAQMPFQILIPAYLPKGFDRAKMTIDASQKGPGDEPMVELKYPYKKNQLLYILEWLPINPDLEILSASRPIETKWGKGWLLSQGEDLSVIWLNIGPLRVSVYSSFLGARTKDQLFEIADTMGPASDQQVFSFLVNPQGLKEMAPPPPVEIQTNAQGIQEVTLVVTPGGYSPIRFAVKVGVPVRLIFKQLGEVGCGNELIFPADPSSPASLTLKDAYDVQVLEFTPQKTGEFQFYCSHQMYRGVMTVHE